MCHCWLSQRKCLYASPSTGRQGDASMWRSDYMRRCGAAREISRKFIYHRPAQWRCRLCQTASFWGRRFWRINHFWPNWNSIWFTSAQPDRFRSPGFGNRLEVYHFSRKIDKKKSDWRHRGASRFGIDSAFTITVTHWILNPTTGRIAVVTRRN